LSEGIAGLGSLGTGAKIKVKFTGITVHEINAQKRMVSGKIEIER
jgi:hypothetical protein